MSNRTWKSLLTLAALSALALTLSTPSDAAACGGCFAPTGSPTVVTRHQMVVSISGSETTLWDQIEYGGAPEDFVWVLPVRGGVAVELADNAFFEALESATGIQLQGRFAPLRTWCPDPCLPWGGAAADAGASAPGGPGSGVTVHHQAAIGPYETVTLGSEDPEALVTWLRDHGYAVPDAVLPTITHYVDQGMDFAVLRLAPGAGVNQMQPVRVTMEGTSPIFPLRMVAAGVEDKVGLELFVIGEGRYEAANFTNSEVDRSGLYYDYSTGGFNYDELWEEAARADGGRAWVTEYAMAPGDWQIRDYRSTDPDTGEVHTAVEDWSIATRSLSAPYLTRMTADLAARFLGEDLVLQASTGEDMSPWIEVYAERNRPSEPSCSTVCTDPRGMEAGGPATPGRSMIGNFACSMSPLGGLGAGSGGSLAGGLGLLALGLFLVRRRRR